MAKPKKFGKKCEPLNRNTSEDFRIEIDQIFKSFLSSPLETEYTFPTTLTNVMRRYVHEKCRRIGMKSKSHGKEPNRTLTIYKKIRETRTELFNLELSEGTQCILNEFNNKNISNPRRIFSCKRQKVQNGVVNEVFGRLSSSRLTHVSKPNPNQLMEFRKTLPIYNSRDEILNTIATNKVVIVTAETGSGKTTQIPQFILDDAHTKSTPIRVICTQPRRLSTVAVAERVAAERGENLGQTVGFQIKLESKIGQRTCLIYCTNGVLLRTLIAGDDCFNNISHVIVDEIHERDKFTDFLLICLRESVMKFPHLRVILMSATMDLNIFTDYFPTAKTISVSGRGFNITRWFLDDILVNIDYENDQMKNMRLVRERNGSECKKDTMLPFASELSVDLSAELAEDVDSSIIMTLENGSEENFTHLLYLMSSENVSPNYQESTNGITPLMVAARHGQFQFLEQFLNLGADPFISCNSGITASGWAQQCNHMDIVEMLATYTTNVPTGEKTVQVLNDYMRTVNDEIIDYNLIITLLEYINANLDTSGAVLIFLPGYEDIIACSDKILKSNKLTNTKIFMLHGSMQMRSQHEVFTKLNNGMQKIVLSTNIAETSLTIDDVMYVIDTGKAKEKSYDASNGVSSLQTHWISMASSGQRAGRAGRTRDGYCFHLYSVKRYESFCVNTTPEILRVPLHELCLQTKMLAPVGTSIESFLALAMEPPSKYAVEKSINTLKTLGALDEEENLTNLGSHLVQLSVEPHLGKMLLYSCIFKCLDPVLTIVTCLAHKDPFILPVQYQKKNAAIKKNSLTEETLSDHMALLRAFQLYQENKLHNRGYKFCEEYYLSSSVMELVVLTRSQLLSQLRAMGFVLPNPREVMLQLNSNSHCWPLVKGCIAAGLYPNMAYYNGSKLHTKAEADVNINIASSLKNSEFDSTRPNNIKHRCWAVFEEITKTHSKYYIKRATVITPISVALLCGLKFEESDGTNILLDDLFEFNFFNPNVFQFREAISWIIDKKISNPLFYLDDYDELVIRKLVEILTYEEKHFDFKIPDNIGEKPIFLEYSSPNFRRQQGHRDNQNHYRHDQQRNNMYGQQRNYNNYRDYNQAGPSRNYHQENWRSNHDHSGSNSYNNFNNSNGHYNHTFYNDEQKNTYYKTSKFENHKKNFDKYASLFPPDAHYYVIKPAEEKNIAIGIAQNIWIFSPHTEKKLFYDFNQGYSVLLVFTVRGSTEFFGVAKLLSTNNGCPNQPCPIEWLSHNKLSYYEVRAFVHPKIHLREDGQALDSQLGPIVCKAICDAPNRNRSNKR